MSTGAATTTQMSNYIAYNTNKNNCSTYYYYPPDDDDDHGNDDVHHHNGSNGATNVPNDNFNDEELYANEYAKLLHPATTTITKITADKFLSKDDSLLLERTKRTTTMPLGNIPKSNSYDSTTALKYSNAQTAQLKSKSTILKQNGLNGHVATSLNESESDIEYGINNNNNCNVGLNKGEYATLDFNSVATNYTTTTAAAATATTNITHSYANNGSMLNVNTALIVSNASGSSSTGSSRRNTRILARTRTTCCYRLHAFLTRNWYLSYLVPLLILLALMFVAYLTRDYAKRLLYWIEAQNSWVTFAIFMLFFILVSFPVVVGYFVLMITAGYLFGCMKGFLTVVLGANLGIAIAHLTIRSLRHRIPMQKLIKNETGRAILRVISGPRAFKVVLFTRLTPLPFGLQNAIFGVSSINPRIYHSATFLGLLPAQAINVYLGSTLRSMHEVLNNHGTAVTGYISFVIEVICGVGLMFWVIQKARKELSDTLISDISNEGKLIDIQV